MIHLWGKNQEKDSRGSATVEAVIAFVGFLFVIFTILNVTNYCRAQMLISNAMDTVTKELTQYSYFYKASGLQKFGEEIQAIGAEGEANLNTIATSVGDLYTAMSGAVDTTLAEGAGLGDRLSSGNIDIQDLNNALTNVDASFTHIKTNLNDMNTKFMDVYNNPVLYMKSLVAVAGNEGLELAKSHVLAAPLAKGLLLKHFGSNKDEADKALEQLGIVDGIDGMNFNMSTIFTKEHPDEIHLVVYYTVELSQMFDWLDLEVNLCKETRARAWLAGDHPVEAKVIPAEEGGAGGGADPNTPEGPATPTAEELKAQMVAKYGQETIDAVCADVDTSGWTEQDWEYQIWLYQNRPVGDELKALMARQYGQDVIDAVATGVDTSKWTEDDWEYQIWLYTYRVQGDELKALMARQYGQDVIDAVSAGVDTSSWTEDDWKYQIYLYRNNSAAEASEKLKNWLVEEYGQDVVDAVSNGVDTSEWTEDDWVYYIWLYQNRIAGEELKAAMAEQYGQETIDAISAENDTSEWTEDDWEYYIWLYRNIEDEDKSEGEEDSGESGSKANKYTLTENLRKHIEDVDLSVPRKRGIGGAHNKNNFLKNDIKVVSITPNNNIKGVETIEYQMPKLDKTGTPIPGEYQGGTPKVKTVYDPDVISTDEYLKRGLEAANNASKNYTDGILPREWVGIDNQGVSWRGYCADGEISSMYPE